MKYCQRIQQSKTYFWDHSRFMPDFWEKAVSISCCCEVRVGTGLDDGVGAGATKARRISSVVAIRMKSWSFTIHKLWHRRETGNVSGYDCSENLQCLI